MVAVSSLIIAWTDSSNSTVLGVPLSVKVFPLISASTVAFSPNVAVILPSMVTFPVTGPVYSAVFWAILSASALAPRSILAASVPVASSPIPEAFLNSNLPVYTSIS